MNFFTLPHLVNFNILKYNNLNKREFEYQLIELFISSDIDIKNHKFLKQKIKCTRITHKLYCELAYKKRKLNKSEKKNSIVSLISEKTKNKNLLGK